MLIVGLPYAHRGTLYNCAAALYGGEILGLVPKTWLPNLAEFYERRYFTSGRRLEGCTVEIGAQTVPFGCDLLFCHRFMPELKVGVELCEDLWAPDPPSTALALAGATVICNPSASDELVTKDEYRRRWFRATRRGWSAAMSTATPATAESHPMWSIPGQNLICENGVLLAESEAPLASPSRSWMCSGWTMSGARWDIFTVQGAPVREIPWGGALAQTGLTRPMAQMPFVPENEALRQARCEKILSIQSLGLKKRIEHTHAGAVVIGVSGGLDSTLAMLVAARAMDLCGRPADRYHRCDHALLRHDEAHPLQRRDSVRGFGRDVRRDQHHRDRQEPLCGHRPARRQVRCHV